MNWAIAGLIIVLFGLFIWALATLLRNEGRKRQRYNEQRDRLLRSKYSPHTVPRSPYTGRPEGVRLSNDAVNRLRSIAKERHTPPPVRHAPQEDQSPTPQPDNSFSNGVVAGMVLEDLTRQRDPDPLPAPDPPSFGGGDFGGGGASDSWSGGTDTSVNTDSGSNFQ